MQITNLTWTLHEVFWPHGRSKGPKDLSTEVSHMMSTLSLVDLLGNPLFHLDDLDHRSFAEWFPSDHVSQ